LKKAFLIPVVAALAAWSLHAGQEPRLTPRLEERLERTRGDEPQAVWVFFRDKGRQSAAAENAARSLLAARALARRNLRGERGGVQFEDLPLQADYVGEVARRVTKVRQLSRWLNAMSAEATPAQIRSLAELPFVARLDVVRRYRRGAPEPVRPLAATSEAARAAVGSPRDHDLDYGSSFGQVDQIKVPDAHDLGYHGEGVVIALFDAGFNNLQHEAFRSIQILAAHDFVNNDAEVADGSDMGEGSHGTETLSVIGGYRPGELIGPAFAASYVLAKTENTEKETVVEEDNWAAAAEWAEALGVDLVSSSLGYLEFDQDRDSYSHRDMDGDTAVSTQAANLLTAKGVVVVNSAGNSGSNLFHNTLGAPADGKKVIATAAVNGSGRRASFSSVGPSADGRTKPDVAAQGVDVKAASPSSATKYDEVDGTSFSCPLTAGVVALILQAHPTYTVDQVISVLKSTASQASKPNNQLGWGIVNAKAAIQAPPPSGAVPR